MGGRRIVPFTGTGNKVGKEQIVGNIMSKRFEHSEFKLSVRPPSGDI